jgi:uncharacterized membrane protein YkvA (DUF1232 family)
MGEILNPSDTNDDIKDLYIRGKQAWDRKAVRDAEQLFEKALKAFRSLNRQARMEEQLSVALSLDQLASLARSQGKHAIAYQRYQESAEVYEQLAAQAEAEGRQDLAGKARLQGKTARQLAQELAAETATRPTPDANPPSQLRGVAPPSSASADRIAQTLEVVRQNGSNKWSWILMIAAGLYTLIGATDILPDVIPVIGELDDIGAIYVFLRLASRLFNIDLLGFSQQRSTPQAKNLPSDEQADGLRRDAKMAEGQGKSSSENQPSRKAEQLYDVMQQDASVASMSLAASLYDLGYQAAHRGDIFFGMSYYRKAAEVFQTVAQAAEAQGNAAEMALARRAAEHTFRLVDQLAEQCDQLLSSPKSEKHELQQKLIAQLDADRARANQSWAQGLGRI